MNLVPELIGEASEMPGPLLVPALDWRLVVVSVLLAAFAGHMTLRVAGHLRTSTDLKRRARLIAVGGFTLGGGIWSMHFTGMLAASLPVEVTYDLGLTGLSLLLPVVASALGLYMIRRTELKEIRLLAAGAVTGCGIVLMHYAGMAAMRAQVAMAYRTDLFLLSVFVAVAAATTAFWFARHFSDETRAEPGRLVGLGTAALMGFAISSMHYIGMAALVIGDRPGMQVDHSFALDPPLMASGVIVVMLITLGVAQLTVAIEENTAGRIRLLAMPLLMAAVAAISGGIATAALYDTAFRRERDDLAEIARAQQALIEAVARFDAQYSAGDVSGGAVAATVGQIRDAHASFGGFGDSGEIYFARMHGSVIENIVPLRFGHGSADVIGDRPMRLALSGHSGTTVAPDYRGERVLAAYTPVPALGLGLVVKIDLAELRAPFLMTASLVLVVTMTLVVAGYVLSRRIATPVARDLDDKARLDVELEYARAVQQGLLPAQLPARRRFSCAARMEPARFVSGDFYDFVELDQKHVAAVIGDVSGKGVSAALLMARVMSDLRGALMLERDPALVLSKANATLAGAIGQGMFVTACCMVVDTETGRAQVANAGHLPLLRRRADGAVSTTAAASGPPLGVLDVADYLSERIDLSAGDVIVAYTDGALEPRNGAGTFFGEARLHRCVAAGGGEPRRVVAAVFAAIDDFVGNNAQADDLTLLAFACGAAACQRP